jgi:hypothetical protein
MMGVVLRDGLSRSVEGLDGFGSRSAWRRMWRLCNELSTRRDPGHGVARKRRMPEATGCCDQECPPWPSRDPDKEVSDGHNDWDRSA